MSLVALLLLCPASFLPFAEPDRVLPDARAATPALAPLIHDRAPDLSSGNSAGEVECADGESTDDEGAIPLLSGPPSPRLRLRDDPRSFLRPARPFFPSSVRSPLLRC